MNLPLTLAWRYLRRPTDRIVSAGGLVSLLGLVIGVMALVISMALMTGYREDLERKILGGNAELILFPVAGMIENPIEEARRAEAIPVVRTASPSIFQQALITSDTHIRGEQVMLKGIEVPSGDSPILQKIIGKSGTFSTGGGPSGIAIGKYLSDKLGLRAGDILTVTVPSEESGSFLPRTRRFIVTSIFSTGFFEFDARWAFIDLSTAQELLSLGDAANVLEVDVNDEVPLERARRELEQAMGEGYGVSDWRDANRQLFGMLQVQQLALFIVIGLIVFVSTFNIVSTLIMTIQEKRKEIGILNSMGADRGLVRRVFVWYGTLVGVIGTVSGLACGVIVCWIITRFELVSFGPEIAEVYFVSSIPFITKPADLAVIGAFSLTISWLATLVPSIRAARLNPSDSLRYE
ncbi:MAG: FtsX-like permease family protein [Acidobacteria bacterium]|nr:FtsX-like permease family protein [Acidobacteriota bacterium]